MPGFDLFGTIAYLAAPDTPRVTARVFDRLRRLGIAERVACVPAMATAGNPRIGTLLSHRGVLQAAAAEGAAPVLVLSGDVLFLDRADEILAAAAPDLERFGWTLAHLGGWWPVVPRPVAGSRHLDQAGQVRDLHAVAYSPPIIPRLLADWPETVPAADDWIDRHGTHERELGRLGGAVILRPVVTTLAKLLPFEPVALQRRFIV